jgi:hypothetical protein
MKRPTSRLIRRNAEARTLGRIRPHHLPFEIATRPRTGRGLWQDSSYACTSCMSSLCPEVVTRSGRESTLPLESLLAALSFSITVPAHGEWMTTLDVVVSSGSAGGGEDRPTRIRGQRRACLLGPCPQGSSEARFWITARSNPCARSWCDHAIWSTETHRHTPTPFAMSTACAEGLAAPRPNRRSRADRQDDHA